MTVGESSFCSVALNHNDFDTNESHVLQATVTTVVSCILKAKHKHGARCMIPTANLQTNHMLLSGYQSNFLYDLLPLNFFDTVSACELVLAIFIQNGKCANPRCDHRLQL